MSFTAIQISSTILSFEDLEATKASIRSYVSETEMKMMTHFGLENGDGLIDKSEFVLLCAIRTGALSPDLLAVITERFNILDVNKTHLLSKEQLLSDGLSQAVVAELEEENQDSLQINKNALLEVHHESYWRKKAMAHSNSLSQKDLICLMEVRFTLYL